MRNTLKRRLTASAVLAALALPVLAACNVAEATERDGETSENSETEVRVGETALGDVVLDSGGMTLYAFKKDKNGESVCYDDCEKAWPPLIAEGDIEAVDGAKADLLGTTERADGSEQVTYRNMPLYYFAKDSEPGDVQGQGAKELWYVVDANGAIIQDAVGEDGDNGEDDTGYTDDADDTKADIELSETAEYGDVLVDSEGMTLYMFFKDENLDNASACYGDCLNKWTPVIVEDEPTVADGLNESLVGTIEREDGTKQATYNDWPMYTFNDDEAPGDLKGVGFKNLWCATDAAGKAAKP